MANSLLTKEADAALKLVEDSQGFHDDLVNKVEKRWKAFEGVLERSSKAAEWMSQLHPPHLNHIVETTIAGLMEDRFAYRVTPVPRFYNDGEFDVAQMGAKAHEILFRDQLKKDRFNEFQRPYVLDAAVVGVAVAKTFWLNEARPSKRKVLRDARRHDPEQYGSSPVALPMLVEEDYVRTVFDGPCTEALDLRDVYWHEAAVSVEKARFFGHAVWNTYDDLSKLAKRGVYDAAAVKQLEKRDGDTGATSDIERSRENRGRNKDMIECLEIWNRETRRVITLGARKVVLRDAPWPFWHGEYPFVFTSLQPYPRSLRGMSIVEKLAHLQEAAWDLMNQRIDNVRFINNFIQIIRSDVDNPEDYPFEPGAQWFMEDPQAVTQWQPQALPGDSLQAESQILAHMQNLAGGQPFTSTSEANQINANTATEAALVTNLAQAAVKAMKTQLFYSYERIGCQRLYLNQQFIDEPVYVTEIGLDNEEEQHTVLPLLLQAGEYMFDVLPMSESLNRSEKRSEASSLFQVAAQSQAICAASGAPWSIRELQRDLLEAYDKQNPERFMSESQPGAVGQVPGQPGQPAPQQQPGGVTAPQSIDPAVSPSTQASLSPAVFGQRALAMSGGVSNAG